jgi:hypothetical protein
MGPLKGNMDCVLHDYGLCFVPLQDIEHAGAEQ